MQKSEDRFPSIAKQGFVYGVFNDSKYVMHAHANIEISCLIEGSFSITIEGRTYILRPGDVALVCSNQFHSHRTLGHSRTFTFGFRPDVIPFYGELFAGKAMLAPVFRRGTYPYEFVDWMNRLLRRSPMSSGKMSELGILLSMLGSLIDENPPIPIEFEDTLERRLIIYVTENCFKPISLSDVAQHFSLSQSAASRLITRVFDVGFTECIRTMRMNTAKRLLGLYSCSITDIAARCGYDSVRTFNRAFFQETGMTPSAYRKNNAYSKLFAPSPTPLEVSDWDDN